jgi:hypothetical protein
MFEKITAVVIHVAGLGALVFLFATALFGAIKTESSLICAPLAHLVTPICQ